MSMMPCMTGWAGLKHMKRGMDSTREIVRNNILRKVSRNRPAKSAKKALKLRVSKSDRFKAALLSKKLEKRTFSRKYVLIVAALTLIIGFLYFHFMTWFLLIITFLTVPYLLYTSFSLAKKRKPYINHKVRNSHFKKDNVRLKVQSGEPNLPDYVI